MTAEARAGGRTGDLWGGFASMVVALPTAIAYGVAIYGIGGLDNPGLGALAGLLGCFALGLVAPVFGGAPRLISGPCGPAMVLLSAFAAEMVKGGVAPGKVLVLLGIVGLASAGLQFLYGAVGGGKLIKFIPYPVVAGYLSGVGVYLISGHVPKLLGLPHGMNGWTGLANPEFWEVPGLIVGLATIAGMVLGPKVTKKVPAVILGLLCGLLAYAALAVSHGDMRTLENNHLVVGRVGASPSALFASFGERLRALGTVGTADLSLVLVPALTLSILLSIDTLKTCVIMDALTRSRHDSNRELRGQGLGNLASGLIGGMPGAGQMGATMVNLNSGGATRLSGILEGAFALLAFVLCTGFLPGLPNLVGWIPKPALAGIIVVVGFRMIDRHSFALLRHRSTILDFVVILAVIVTANAVSMIAASGVGLALAVMLFVREQIRGTVVRRKLLGSQMSSKKHRLPSQVPVLREQGARTTICMLQGTLFFGTTDQLLTILEQDLKTCRYLILDMRRVSALDYTAAHMLEQMEGMLTERGAYLIFSGLPAILPTGQDLHKYFEQLGLVARERNVRLVDELDDALEWVEDRILEEAGEHDDPAGPPLALREFDLFKEFDPDSIRILQSVIHERGVKSGEAAFRRGEKADELFLIRRGTMEIHLPLEGGRSHHLATFPRGSFFGDMAFLDRGERSADAIAAEDTDLFILSRGRFDELSHRHPATGAMLFARLARILAIRLRQTDAELRALEES